MAGKTLHNIYCEETKPPPIVTLPPSLCLMAPSRTVVQAQAPAGHSETVLLENGEWACQPVSGWPLALRDAGDERVGRQGLNQAVVQITTMGQRLLDMDPLQQAQWDSVLTEQEGMAGNVSLALSMAALAAAQACGGLPLYEHVGRWNAAKILLDIPRPAVLCFAPGLHRSRCNMRG